MFAKLFRYFIMLVLEKIGLIDSREIQGNTESGWGDRNSWQDDAGTIDGTWHEVHENEPEAVDGTWREYHEEEDKKKEDTDSGMADSESPATLEDNIKALSEAASGIRNQKIREQAFHVLLLAKDIINEHEGGHNKCRNYRQFETYYVPTVTSVVRNYCSMEAKGMVTSKMEEDVLAYLESCGDAFTHLYNSMFSDDITTMEVQMEAMDLIMKRDGLLK